VPETFSEMRGLLDILDDVKIGKCMSDLETELPLYSRSEAEKMVALAGETLMTKYKVEEGIEYCSVLSTTEERDTTEKEKFRSLAIQLTSREKLAAS
jgi:hypothetical protein